MNTVQAWRTEACRRLFVWDIWIVDASGNNFFYVCYQAITKKNHDSLSMALWETTRNETQTKVKLSSL